MPLIYEIENDFPLLAVTPQYIQYFTVAMEQESVHHDVFNMVDDIMIVDRGDTFYWWYSNKNEESTAYATYWNTVWKTRKGFQPEQEGLLPRGDY